MLYPSIYRLRLQDILALCVMALLCLGIIMVQSAAMSLSNVGDLPRWHWTDRGTKHIIYAIAALLTFFIVGHTNYTHLARGTWWRNPIMWLLGIAAFTCVFVLVPIPGVTKAVNGAQRWINLGFAQFQPSELGKWAIVLFLAWCLTTRPIDTTRFTGFIMAMVPVGVVCLLIVIEDLGTAALVGLCAMAMCLAGGIKLWHLAVALPPALLGGLAFFLQPGKEYRWKRMTAFLDPFASPEREGYHMIQSLLSFSTGGVFGRGLGRGIQKLDYLPEDTTDFIFAVIGEELGLFGAMLTIALYLGILYVVWQVARQKRDAFGRLLAFGVGAMTGLQALINIAVATVSVPPKGLSLPLVSAGGSGLLITCAALGLLYSICRHNPEELPLSVELPDPLESAPADSPLTSLAA